MNAAEGWMALFESQLGAWVTLPYLTFRRFAWSIQVCSFPPANALLLVPRFEPVQSCDYPALCRAK